MGNSKDIESLFRTRLSDARMDVREGFWEALEHELAPVTPRKWYTIGSRRLRHVAAAASVVFVLGAASAAFWFLSRQSGVEEAFEQVAALAPEAGLRNAPAPQTPAPVPPPGRPAHEAGAPGPAPYLAPAGETGDEPVSVRLSITIRQQMYAPPHERKGRAGGAMYAAQGRTGHPSGRPAEARPTEENAPARPEPGPPHPHRWALKVGIGSALPKGPYSMPFTAGASVERSLGKTFAIEAGVLYNCLPGVRTLHTLSVPLRLNATLASRPRFDVYATAGGAVEKCIAGAPDNGFAAEPLRLSVEAGLGVRYKLDERLALFAQPTVTHHFRTSSENASLRTARDLNLNLMCGIRLTY